MPNLRAKSLQFRAVGKIIHAVSIIYKEMNPFCVGSSLFLIISFFIISFLGRVSFLSLFQIYVSVGMIIVFVPVGKIIVFLPSGKVQTPYLLQAMIFCGLHI